ncbi:hypothetical protein H2200_001769 [Cladophialophora chaetospira]|uniref:Uncharacterized protein n=1 Tax=Cladophialophora chaetospira TaxID=386627 RepID=A0AA38XLM5_9EURO|nr:hypothetical protein H2200_001769 [Cladophialophora chaetospira]
MAQRKLDPSSFDRTDLVDVKDDPDTLPHDVLFHRLHYLACHQDTVAVRERHRGLDITYQRLLSDTVSMKTRLLEQLHPATIKKLDADEEVAIVIFARGYEFVVGYFAILAVGGIAVPTSPHVTLDEALHFVTTCRAHAVVHSPAFESLASQLRGQAGVTEDYRPISMNFLADHKPLNPRNMRFSMRKIRDLNKPGALIFTSGSTGKPKGATMRRYNIIVHSMLQIWKNDIRPGYTILQMLPTHHATGLVLNTIPTIIGGGCVEFTQPKFDAAMIWDRIHLGGIRSISAVPTIYVRLLQYWEHELQELEPVQKESYRTAMSSIEQFHVGTSSLPTNVSTKWAELFGRRILERYGGTEFGNPYTNYSTTKLVPGSVGVKNPGVESYLEHGDEGEIFARTPLMFSKYIYNVDGTRESLTSEGYFKTGDTAERIDDHYFIKGRTSVDLLKTGGYKVSALDIEREILALPQVSETIVVGVEDAEFGQRVAAAVVLKEGCDHLSLQELRDSLRASLSNYKLPTILRVVPELRKTANMKIPKLLLKKELFESGHPDIQVWRSGGAKL